jgi:uncharacterized protein (TIGR02646 family)
MRPVVRGDVPVDDNGDPETFTDYKQARDPLIKRMGDYCSYCEIKIHTQVDVEHVLPKSPNPALALEWTNFLLACGNCNSIKSDKDIELDEIYWADKDNSLRAFVYEQDQPPQIADDPDVDVDIAYDTIKLTGLDRVPGVTGYSDRDRRWLKRIDAWSTAMQVADFIEVEDTDEMRQMAIFVAKGIGFWSVWFEVFHDDEEMCQRLIDEFPGSAVDCFDIDTNILPRPGGQI